MTKKPKEMVRLLKKQGYIIKSQNGSHVKLYNEDSKSTIIVPMHAKELKKGTENAIMKQAGLT